MTLVEMIQKRKNLLLATATVATPATDRITVDDSSSLTVKDEKKGLSPAAGAPLPHPSMSACPISHANDGNVPMPGTRIVWMRGDGVRAQGTVIEVLIDPLAVPPVTVLVTLDNDSWAVLNPRVVQFEVVEDR